MDFSESIITEEVVVKQTIKTVINFTCFKIVDINIDKLYVLETELH